MERHLAEYLLKHYFSSKKDMACALCIPYSVMLSVFKGESSVRSSEKVMIGIALYCLAQRIPPEELFHGYAPI